MATKTVVDDEGNEYTIEVPDAPVKTSDEGPAQLRKALKAAEDARKAADAELAQYKAKERTREIETVLATKGVKPQIAKFIPAEVAAPDQIEKWLTENADVFGFQTTDPNAGQLDPGRQAAADASNRIHGSTEGANVGSDEAAMRARLSDPNLTQAELDAITGIKYNTPGRIVR